ncbi:hypothetical protein KAFR_0B05920 [Kazachstania africana CBS 2517]|uniref:Hsp90 chaperone protein kinase-targeting subunit n=1 Tax=Kazachstania africana (strain ATCC 22294 / BCRC 22015 / CBS 2517 / CECT 1963 / NBRC 1671 / NRRL Y-8276) TaxID=1071382 RepID=H2AR88_KAZAF|nr:hypothetical protein KAFR_0B05920 [Kazachstania africana CBS 2517]CCF56888.1 hypothetical protein KAFR_0B05920 [Kazachstania africana CBS 2517]
MPIDYSKWDKIELSDDSDVEVHPNVDKKSFIKWKQQSIHEQRFKRNQDIKNLETQVDMYANLNKRVDKILQQVDVAKFADLTSITKFLNENFDKVEKSAGDNVDPDIATYNEMVEDLFEQLKGDAKKENKNPEDGTIIKQLLLNHRSKIDSVTVEAKEKLDELYKEKQAHISSEDVHTGFDSGFMNKKKDSEDDKAKNVNKAMESMKIKQDDDETIRNIVLNSAKVSPPMEFIDYKDDVLKLAPETEAFGSIPFNEYKQMEQYLVNNMQIISEQQKDALMMKSFEYQMDDDDKEADTKTYQIIHQSELLGYIREIYDLKKISTLNVNELKEVISMFFNKVIFNTSNTKGKESFLQSVSAKFNHVKQRSKIIREEQSAEEVNVEGVETIQLKSLDDSTELEVNLPDFSSKDANEIRKCEVFNTLSVEMQEALKTQSLDKVNEVFAKMTIEDAENVLDIFNEAEIIGVKALLENEDDFNEIKREYNREISDEGNYENINDVVD